MLGRRLGVVALVGQAQGGLQRLLGLDGEAIRLHGRYPILGRKFLVRLTEIIAPWSCDFKPGRRVVDGRAQAVMRSVRPAVSRTIAPLASMTVPYTVAVTT